MSDSHPKLQPVLARLRPDYYPEFQCVGSACQDTCCAEWRIDLTKKDYMAYRRLPQTEQLASAVKRLKGPEASDAHYATLCKGDERCPLLDASGLCTLQLTHGAEALPAVCRGFPRMSSISPAYFLEEACSTGCEVVLELLYQRKDGLGFVQDALPPKEQFRISFENRATTQYFVPLRELCIDILQDRSTTLPLRMLLLGWLLRDVDERQNAQEPWDVPTWLAERRILVRSAELREQLARIPGNQMLFVMHNLKLLFGYNSPAPSFIALLAKVTAQFDVRPRSDATGFLATSEPYAQMEQDFLQNYGDLEYFFENILVNSLFSTKIPAPQKSKSLWTQYLDLCNLYGASRFMAVCGCHGHSDLKRLIHVLTVTHRAFLHNAQRQAWMVEQLQYYESNTLMDMAVILHG